MFSGSIVALVTPFTEKGGIDFPALEKLIEWHSTAGTSALVMAGTTGEAPTLSTEEYAELIKFTVKTLAGRLPVIAGCGANDTNSALHKTKIALEAGAQAGLSVAPYYNKPTQAGMLAHFTKIADGCELPLILYNVPGRTASSIAPETLAKLSEHPRIAGVKEASADMQMAAEIRRLARPDFILLSGDDFTALPFYAVGGTGVISVTGNIAPGMTAEIWRLFSNGDLEGALKLHLKLMPLNKALFWEPNPIPVKAALSLMGKIRNELRLPLTPLSPDKMESLAKVIAEYR